MDDPRKRKMERPRPAGMRSMTALQVPPTTGRVDAAAAAGETPAPHSPPDQF